MVLTEELLQKVLAGADAINTAIGGKEFAQIQQAIGIEKAKLILNLKARIQNYRARIRQEGSDRDGT